MAQIAIIAAVAENGVIGSENDMPWKISADLRFFKKQTLGKPIIMGRKTLFAIGKALPGRINIIVTRDQDFKFKDVLVSNSLEDAIVTAKKIAHDSGIDEILIGGGGEIYKQAMELATTLYITRVHASPKGDTKFPKIDSSKWFKVSTIPLESYPNDTASVSVITFQRRNGN